MSTCGAGISSLYRCHRSKQNKMIIYIFKGSKGDIQTLNEVGAHNELNNRGHWQRQDLVYLGACDDTPLKEEVKDLKTRAIEKVLAGLPQIKLAEQEVELAKLNDDVQLAQKKTLELDILKGGLESKIRDRSQFISSEIENLQIKVQKIENELYEEAFAKLKPDPTKKPRNFNNVTSGFSGDSDPLPTNVVLDNLR